MAKIPCPVCGEIFESKTIGREKRFCSRNCFRKDYRQRLPVPSTAGQTYSCDICGEPFVKTKSHQRYCSPDCYDGAWMKNNRDKHNARIRKRRKDKPEWYREHEPKYYKTYRSSQLLAMPWIYSFKSRQAEARLKDWPFDLTHEWAAARWTGRCEITNIPFQTNGKAGPWPFSPSLDKIDPIKGYTQSNSRFILWGCNAIKGVGTDADMCKIAKGIVDSPLFAQYRP